MCAAAALIAAARLPEAQFEQQTKLGYIISTPGPSTPSPMNIARTLTAREWSAALPDLPAGVTATIRSGNVVVIQVTGREPHALSQALDLVQAAVASRFAAWITASRSSDTLVVLHRDVAPRRRLPAPAVTYGFALLVGALVCLFIALLVVDRRRP